jgi:hypothetical protein
VYQHNGDVHIKDKQFYSFPAQIQLIVAEQIILSDFQLLYIELSPLYYGR